MSAPTLIVLRAPAARGCLLVAVGDDAHCRLARSRTCCTRAPGVEPDGWRDGITVPTPPCPVLDAPAPSVCGFRAVVNRARAIVHDDTESASARFLTAVPLNVMLATPSASHVGLFAAVLAAHTITHVGLLNQVGSRPSGACYLAVQVPEAYANSLAKVGPLSPLPAPLQCAQPAAAGGQSVAAALASGSRRMGAGPSSPPRAAGQAAAPWAARLPCCAR